MISTNPPQIRTKKMFFLFWGRTLGAVDGSKGYKCGCAGTSVLTANWVTGPDLPTIPMLRLCFH